MSQLNDYFVYKCEQGLIERGLADKPEYRERLKFEIDTIISMGFPGYFLIVQDFIDWARKNDVYVGPGRGSAAGSLVSYCLHITDLDPIRWGLLFERFLNPSRISMPDIDVDFEKKSRDKVIQYVSDKYGEDHVAHIGTFNMKRAKASVRSIAKILGHPYAVGDQLAKLCMAPVHGKGIPLSVSIERVKELNDYRRTNSTQGEVLRWAEKVEDHISSVGVHASGVVISNNSMMTTVPMFLGKSGERTTQWEMNNIEEVGLIKFDFLGLDALTKIHDCVDLVKEQHGVNINIRNIDLEDQEVYEKLRSGDQVGIFQLEASGGMQDLLVQIRPTCLEDLTALVAIYRPGPMTSSYKNTYLDVRAGNRSAEYLVPELEPYLAPTNGWLIYQEQCMHIAKGLCGYSGADADHLRKAIGKKIPEKMALHEPKFKEGWKKRGLPEDKGDELWEDMVSFASYGFNKSHAAAYALITYQTAWLKTHYTTEYMCAAMISDAGDKDQMIKYLSECKRLSIDVLPPDINKSRATFHVDGPGVIRFGLGPIKNLGAGSTTIIEERESGGPFTDIRNFCERVDTSLINSKKVDSLIRSGAFDSFGMTRASLIDAIPLIWEHKKQMKSYSKKLETYQKKLEAYEQRLADIEDGKLSDKGKKLRPFKEPERPGLPAWPELPEIDEFSKKTIQDDEHELLGFYVTSHPLDGVGVKAFGQRFNSIHDVKQMDSGTRVSLAVVITKHTEITTAKSKKQMSFPTLEDMTGSIESVCFPNVYSKYGHHLEESGPMMVRGFVDVVEADDGRVTKIKIQRIDPLKVQDEDDISERIEATVKASRIEDFLNLVEKYKGTLHEVRVAFQMDSGVQARCPTIVRIGNYKGAFMRELAKLNNDEHN